VALGEAFINVRADLKPFAKDVEKGVKEILRAVEKRLVADGQFGRTLSQNLQRQTSDGISNGIEDGFDRGMRRGTRRALGAGQRFFAALANFADDGLSAIPAEVKAGLIVGVGSAAAVVAPLLAGAISVPGSGGPVHCCRPHPARLAAQRSNRFHQSAGGGGRRHCQLLQ
jgi:hypothetical protein